MTIAAWYLDFARRQARGESPTYDRLARSVAEDAGVLALLATVPPGKQQPNLLFAVVRLLGGPVHEPAAFSDFVLDRWPAIKPELLTRATQTNEIGRCALLMPALARLPQPLALLEVGASAGLNLFPDRYAYRYGDHRLGADGPLLDCAATGFTPPGALPEVVWRTGIDRNPLDVRDEHDLAWLGALVWPEHEDRRARLHSAAAIAAADPPHLVRGDLLDDLAAVAATAPPDATLVVFHSSVLYQVPENRRAAFTALAASLPGHWISIEDPAVLTFANLPSPPADGMLKNVLAVDGKPLAWTHGHGRRMTWFGD